MADNGKLYVWDANDAIHIQVIMGEELKVEYQNCGYMMWDEYKRKMLIWDTDHETRLGPLVKRNPTVKRLMNAN